MFVLIVDSVIYCILFLDDVMVVLFIDSVEICVMLFVEGVLVCVQGQLGIIFEIVVVFIDCVVCEVQIDFVVLVQEMVMNGVLIFGFVVVFCKVMQVLEYV